MQFWRVPSPCPRAWRPDCPLRPSFPLLRASRPNRPAKRAGAGCPGHGHDGEVLFVDLAATSAAVSATSGRRAKVALLSAALRALGAAGDAEEIEVGAAYLAGEMRQRQIGVGWAAIRDVPEPAAQPSLTVLDVDN